MALITTSAGWLVQNLVHSPTAKSLKVERHILKTQFAKPPGQVLDYLQTQCSRHLRGRNFQPNKTVVVAHAKLPEAELPQNFFASIHD